MGRCSLCVIGTGVGTGVGTVNSVSPAAAGPRPEPQPGPVVWTNRPDPMKADPGFIRLAVCVIGAGPGTMEATEGSTPQSDGRHHGAAIGSRPFEPDAASAAPGGEDLRRL